MRELVWHCAIIVIVAGTIFFTNLGQSRLWDRDEPRNAGCAAEMMARGDWVVPMFNDELRHFKPVLTYWLMISAYSIFGVNEFSARFWSSVLAVGTALATYGIARRLTNTKTALLAGIALSSSLMFDVAARAATPDSALIFCGTVSIWLYVRGTFVPKPDGQFDHPKEWFPRHTPTLIAMFAMMGLGVLAKGPVGFVLPMAIIGMFMLIMRLPESSIAKAEEETWFARWKVNLVTCLRTFHPWHFAKTVWHMRPALAAVTVLAVALPWYWLVHVQTDGDFTRRFFVGEHFGRATTVMENHRGGIWFYPLAILVGFFPWSVFWGPVVAGLFFGKSNSRDRIANTFMLCWICVQVGAFTIAQTKLPSYISPCYPALAIITAICITRLVDLRDSFSRGWLCAAFGGLIFSGLLIAVGFGYGMSIYLPDQVWLASLGLIPIVGGCYLLRLSIKNNLTYLPHWFAGVSVLFCWIFFGFGTIAVDSERNSHLVWDQIKRTPDAHVATYGALESSWVYYAGQPMYEIKLDLQPPINEQDLAAQKASLNRTSFWKPKARVSVDAFLDAHPNAMFVTTGEHAQMLQQRLPDGYKIVGAADYFLKNEKVVLLGKPDRVAKQVDTQSAIKIR